MRGIQMNRKGMALEMIIMLIMLLVVAGVIISIFIGQFTGNKFGAIGQSALTKQKFLSNCEQLCTGITNPITAAAFCEEHANVDLNEDGSISQTEIQKTDKQYQACENRIYCFMVYDCPRIRLQGKEAYMVQACARLACNAEMPDSASPQDADQKVSGANGKLVSGVNDPASSCKLDFPSWYDNYVGPTPCSKPFTQ